MHECRYTLPTQEQITAASPSSDDIYETEIPTLPDRAILTLLKREEVLINSKLQFLHVDYAFGGQTVKRLQRDLNQVQCVLCYSDTQCCGILDVTAMTAMVLLNSDNSM